MKRDQSKVQPIRLGGEACLSLEELPELVASPDEVLDIDWPEVLRKTGFTEDERAYLVSTKVEGNTHKAAIRELNWPADKGERTKRACNRKLQTRRSSQSVDVRPRCTASSTVWLEQLPSGHRLWQHKNISL